MEFPTAAATEAAEAAPRGGGGAGAAGGGRQQIRAAVRIPRVVPDSFTQLTAEVVSCRRCPRLVEWREAAAADPPSRYATEEYWARPLPGFGDAEASVLMIGLAPAAHGGNRTGRIFTGDRSGDFLFDSLYRTGFANQPTSIAPDDGLTVSDLYIAAVVRCAPPDNQPLPLERDCCLPYLVRELRLLHRVRVIVALGAYAWDGACGGPCEESASSRWLGPSSATSRRSGSALTGCWAPSIRVSRTRSPAG